MLRPYWGAMFFCPAMLHLDLNRCSNGCFYCFANLNKPTRREDLRDFKNALTRGRFVPWALETKQTVCISNTSDPLAASNREIMPDLLAVLRKRGCRVFWQTKGADDYSMILRDAPCMVYVSVTSDDAAWSARIEPGAPAPDARVSMIADLAAHGCRVFVGLNPFRADWFRDLPAFLARLDSAGACVYVIEVLRFSALQCKYAPARQDPQLSPMFDEGRRGKFAKAELDVIHGQIKDRVISWSGGHYGMNPYIGMEAMGYPWTPTFADYCCGREHWSRSGFVEYAMRATPEATPAEWRDGVMIAGGLVSAKDTSWAREHQSWRGYLESRARTF